MTNRQQLTTLAIATTSLFPLLLASCAVSPAAGPPSVPLSALSAQSTCDNWHRPEFFASASVERVRECIEAGAPLHDPLLPAIFLAARSATDPAVIRVLTDAGADPTARMASGYDRSPRARYTPLHTAAASNPVPTVIDALVAAGADVNARNRDGKTPLHAAWTNPNPAVVQALLRSGADPLARDQAGRVADPTSCANWNTPAFVKLALPSHFELCLAQGEDLHARDGRGDTPLHLAAQSEALASVTLLLSAGADFNVRNRAGATPLHAAVYNKGAEIVTALLQAGSEVDAERRCTYGTPLLHAVATGSADHLVRQYQRESRQRPAGCRRRRQLWLIRWGRPRCWLPWAPAAEPAPSRDLPLRLLALGADPNARDSQGRTPLHQAAALGEGPDVIRGLLEAGADPQALARRWLPPRFMPVPQSVERRGAHVAVARRSGSGRPGRRRADSLAPCRRRCRRATGGGIQTTFRNRDFSRPGFRGCSRSLRPVPIPMLVTPRATHRFTCPSGRGTRPWCPCLHRPERT